MRPHCFGSALGYVSLPISLMTAEAHFSLTELSDGPAGNSAQQGRAELPAGPSDLQQQLRINVVGKEADKEVQENEKNTTEEWYEEDVEEEYGGDAEREDTEEEYDEDAEREDAEEEDVEEEYDEYIEEEYEEDVEEEYDEKNRMKTSKKTSKTR
uniref:Acidic leucine-rich nuclear phosphoprotein 32-related protein 2-like n=1 Tax=Haemonchus contortus TaxID=6289 RepID=A0A7I5E815_HAECO